MDKANDTEAIVDDIVSHNQPTILDTVSTLLRFMFFLLCFLFGCGLRRLINQPTFTFLKSKFTRRIMAPPPDPAISTTARLNGFFLAHRYEDWFKNKYHPDESTKKKEEQYQNLKKRVNIFMEFMDKKRFEGITLDASQAEKLTKLMDWYVIRLEGDSDEFAAKVLSAEPRSNRPSISISSPIKDIRTSELEKEESKENGSEKKKTKHSAGDEVGAASESDEEGREDMQVTGEEEQSKVESPRKKRISADSGGPQSVVSLDDEESGQGAQEAPPKVEEKRKVEEPEVEELPQLHKTSAVFLRNIPASVSKAEVDGICLKHDGFLRSALTDPQEVNGQWYRHGWVTFKRNVDIKEISRQLNNIEVKGAKLEAVVFPDLTRRVRTVNGITAHKMIVRHDIRLAAQVIHFLDSKWNLWDEDPEAGKKESFGVYSTNPVLKNITDYLIEEASAEEEELLAMGGGSDGELEPGESRNSEKGNSIERDEELIQVLDRLIFYLRFVHSLDYYNHAEYPYEDGRPNRLEILNVRGLPPTSNVVLPELQDYKRNFEQKIATFCEKSEPLTDEECRSLGSMDEDVEVEKFITASTQKYGNNNWECLLSGNVFNEPESVRNHIQTEHVEQIEEVKKKVAYFNNYLRDPKRPMSLDFGPPLMAPKGPHVLLSFDLLSKQPLMKYENLNNPGGSGGRAASGSVTPSASEQEMQNLVGSMSQSQPMQLLGGMSEMGGSGLLAQLNQLAPGLANLGGGGGGSSSTDGAASTATETASSDGGSGTGTGTGPKPQSLLKVKKPNTPVAPKTPAANTLGPIQLEDKEEDLQSILTRMQTTLPEVQVDLDSDVSSDAIQRITACPNTVQKKKLVPLLHEFCGVETSQETTEDGDEVLPLLPRFGGAETSEGAAQHVEETLKSPQFQSALSAFCAAFPTGQLGPQIAQFGFSADAVTAAQNGNLEAFINAIQAETSTEAPSASDVVSDSQDSVTELTPTGDS